jgi:hypothetical protein
MGRLGPLTSHVGPENESREEALGRTCPAPLISPAGQTQLEAK